MNFLKIVLAFIILFQDICFALVPVKRLKTLDLQVFFQNGKVVLKNENLHARLADQVSDFRKIIPQKAIDIRRQQGASGGNIACAVVQFVFEDGVIVQQDILSKRALLPFFTTVHDVSENWESYDGNLIQNLWICFPSLGEVTVPEKAQKLSSIPGYIDTELQIAESFFSTEEYLRSFSLAASVYDKEVMHIMKQYDDLIRKLESIPPDLICEHPSYTLLKTLCLCDSIRDLFLKLENAAEPQQTFEELKALLQNHNGGGEHVKKHIIDKYNNILKEIGNYREQSVKNCGAFSVLDKLFRCFWWKFLLPSNCRVQT